MLKEKVKRVREQVAAACQRAGREAAEVTLVAVSKGYSADEIRQALEAGITHIGESRIQEAKEKISIFRLPSSVFRLTQWHLIGHLQTNKVRQAVSMFDLIQSVDSLRLAELIDREAARVNKSQNILLEIKTSPEASKTGIKPEAAQGILERTAVLKHIKVSGLMTIAPYSSDPEAARPYFRQLRSLSDELFRGPRTEDHGPVLSMGMTDDFEVAIEEGATMVRIGRGIFGGE